MRAYRASGEVQRATGYEVQRATDKIDAGAAISSSRISLSLLLYGSLLTFVCKDGKSAPLLSFARTAGAPHPSFPVQFRHLLVSPPGCLIVYCHTRDEEG